MGTPTDRSVFVFRLVGGINKLGHLQFRLVGTPTDRKNTIDGVAVNNAAATLGNLSFVSSLGYDADIVTLDNATKNYLTNSATNATIKFPYRLISLQAEIIFLFTKTPLSAGVPTSRNHIAFSYLFV